jgi:anthranilate/para-aminobenzoate synthase component II
MEKQVKQGPTLAHLGYGTGTHRPFDQVYPNTVMLTPEDIGNGKHLDALVIWGGADISPTLYGESPADLCGADIYLSKRDSIEADAVEQAIGRDIPIIGVCRGAQLLCAMAGGRLIQHVDNHGITHDITTNKGDVIRSSSVHHQMMFPFEVEHELLAWSTKKRSQRYITSTNETDPAMEQRPEPEIVWFPKIRALAIQGHPEFHSNPEQDPFVQHCLGLVRHYCLGSHINRAETNGVTSHE